MTSLCAMAIDVVGPDPAAIVDELLRIGDTDTLRYRTPWPRALAERQDALWQPLLQWFGSMQGITMSFHDDWLAGESSAKPSWAELCDSLGASLASIETFRLAGLLVLARILGSLVTAMGIVARRIDGEQAFRIAFLETLFQAERWGADPEQTARFKAIREDIADVERFLFLLEPEVEA